MIKGNKNEMSHLISVGLEDEDTDNKNHRYLHQQQLTRWKATTLMLVFAVTLMMIMIIHRTGNTSNNDDENHEGLLKLVKGENRKCMFCDIQSPPTLHEEKSYKIMVENNHNDGDGDGGLGIDVDVEEATVTPMTITYNYELYNGQLLFTDPSSELIPNLDFNYAILGVNGLRNINRETNEPVSLDEVYCHHFTFHPLNMVGAEALTRDESIPLMKFPKGYGLHVIYEEAPDIKINAHLLSNKDLAPIDGSISLAHKHCNECYYAPGKGYDCTPEVSGTLKCCGDSQSCTANGKSCACATNIGAENRLVTKYQIQVDMLISRDINTFKRIDQWAFAAPACHVNLHGDSTFKKYSPDNYCYNNSMNLYYGGGSIFHQIELQDDDHPYVETKINSIAPTSGKIVWAQSHLHTGGVNATLRLNGEIICSTGTTYGTDMNENANARNEQNHLIFIDSCYETDIFQDGGVHFNEGDLLTTESIYNGNINDDRFVGYGAGGEHKNVMSMFFMGVVFEGEAIYLSEKRTSFSHFDDLAYTVGLF